MMARNTKDLTKIISLLERLSLVDFANKNGIKRLEEAIRFADQIHQVNTHGVEPMITPMEKQCTYLRDDILAQTNRKSATQNASKMIEHYFVAPPGNIPIETKTFEDYNK